ncbi:MAG: hypothetical protein ACYSUS_05765 [Planctomycetota bacterium]|jgi:hypothetical protein
MLEKILVVGRQPQAQQLARTKHNNWQEALLKGYMQQIMPAIFGR